MPTERSGGARAVHKGRIYVAGGEHQDNYLMPAFRELEASDPASNSWEELPHMNRDGNPARKGKGKGVSRPRGPR